jgi:hypothetical protein
VIAWLNENSGAVVALATVVLVLVTTAYVVLTARLVQEQRQQRQTATVPALTYELAGLDALVLRNVGFGPALGIEVDPLPRAGAPAGMTLDAQEPYLEHLGPGQATRIRLRGTPTDTVTRAWLPVIVRYADVPWEQARIDLLTVQWTGEGAMDQSRC